jgi:histone H3/H4
MSVVAARIKEMVAKAGMRTGGDFVEALDKCLEEMVKKAVHRAKENKRQTVYACDC